ncbi:MAG: glycogen synthase [Candidatus Gastranaerophilales bacterium]|nr:glycogen synthase [Candidatus Gastranaerophilales bacterium]
MNILFVSAEVSPFAKVGGLADVAGSLPKYIKNLGHEIKVVMPAYGCIDYQKYGIEYVNFPPLTVQMGSSDIGFGVMKGKLPNSDVEIYFLANDGYFGNFNYIYPQWVSNRFEHERYAVFSKAVLEFTMLMDFKADIIHCNDWHTATIPMHLKESFKYSGFHGGMKSIFTIHNLAYQGRYSKDIVDFIGFPADWAWRFDMLECCKEVNMMKGALKFADKITTVSPTYAFEIQRGEYGEGLEQVLYDEKYKTCGILNGIDYNEWNPATDKKIFANYSKDDLSGKLKCKLELQKKYGLEVNESIPLIGIVSRLVNQKGLDLIAAIAHEFKQMNAQMIVLGSGEGWYEDMFRHLGLNSRNIRDFIGYNATEAEYIYSGADMFLMPSRFEPCGISQLIAMAFGTVPIVRETGGLVDTVQNYNNETQEGTGFKFWNYDANGLLDTIKWACDVFKDKKAWQELVRRDMEQDFSWNLSAQKYIWLYEDVLKI